MLTLGQALHHLRQFSRSCDDIIGLIPSQHEEVHLIVIKCIGLADKLFSYFYGGQNVVSDYFDNLGAIKKNSSSFPQLFFNDLKKPEYKISKSPIDSFVTCITVTIPGNGSLYFVEDCFDEQKRELYNEFYYTPGFNFRSLLSVLWEKYDNRVYVSLNIHEKWQRNTVFSTFPRSSSHLFGSSKERLSSLRNKMKSFKKRGIHRSYLFLGPPGTGKSSFAKAMANKKERVIKFDAKTLENLDSQQMEFFIDNLGPDFIIVDDIDKLSFTFGNSTLLYVLETIKEKHPGTTIILTANEIQRLDPALLRPGRVDEILEFECSAEDRRNILVGYLKEYDLSLTESELDLAIDATEGFTGAFIKEFSIRLSESPLEEVLDDFWKRRRLMKLIDSDSDSYTVSDSEN